MITARIGDKKQHKPFDWQKDPDLNGMDGHGYDDPETPSDAAESAPGDKSANESSDDLWKPSWSQIVALVLLVLICAAGFNYWTKPHWYFVSYEYSYANDPGTCYTNRRVISYPKLVTTKNINDFLLDIEQEIKDYIDRTNTKSYAEQYPGRECPEVMVNILYYQEVERTWWGWLNY